MLFLFVIALSPIVSQACYWFSTSECDKMELVDAAAGNHYCVKPQL